MTSPPSSVPELLHVGRADRGRDEAAAGTENPRDLARRPGRGRARGRASSSRPRSRTRRPRTAAPGRRRRSRRSRGSRVSSTIRAEMSTATTSAPSSRWTRSASSPMPQPTSRKRCGLDSSTASTMTSSGLTPSGQLAVRLVPLREPLLARVLPLDDERVVELHGSMIGLPGMPRPGALPPSQAFTVAPTSANSPSWTRLVRSDPRRRRAAARARASGRSTASSDRSRGRR